MLDDQILTTQKILKPLRLGIAKVLPDETFLKASADIVIDSIAGQMVAQLTTSVMTETISEHTKTLAFDFEFEIPASWYDDFKDRHMPAWFLQRFPVRYKTIRRKRTRDVSFRQYVKYPNFRAVPPSHEFFPVMESTINPVWQEPDV